MSPPDSLIRSSSRQTAARLTCPACQAVVSAGATHCPSCHFTGADSMKLFPGAAPPLLPILDVAELWNAADSKKIETARIAIEKRFPQFRWHFCSVDMPPTTSLSLLGFWILNASPLNPPETENQRAWTVMLLVNRSNGQATVIPGYAAEPWFTAASWLDALSAMKSAWRVGESGKSVADFLATAGKILEREWKNSNSSRKS